MTARQINLTLQITTLALCGVALVCIITGVFLPLSSLPASTPAAHPKSVEPSPGTSAFLPPLDTFAGIWTNPLRRPLSDIIPFSPTPTPQPGASAVVPGSATNIPLTLVGTIGSSLALLKNADGLVEVKAVGDVITGVEILAIHPAHVDVRYAGRSITLDKVPPDTDAQMIQGDSVNITDPIGPTTAMHRP